MEQNRKINYACKEIRPVEGRHFAAFLITRLAVKEGAIQQSYGHAQPLIHLYGLKICMVSTTQQIWAEDMRYIIPTEENCSWPLILAALVHVALFAGWWFGTQHDTEPAMVVPTIDYRQQQTDLQPTLGFGVHASRAMVSRFDAAAKIGSSGTRHRHRIDQGMRTAVHGKKERVR